MSPDFRSWGAAAARLAGWASRGALVAALALLGGVLAEGAIRSLREEACAAGREAVAAREIERLRRQNAVLREELRALETDPAYVEALLRRWKQAGPQERLVE